ncbi:GNAT family N-acetyltransferase [Cohnella soli]|uniref:GNAT family N-acetyltransferase n=1 Tax=Cohnella soli TaxID=425005 RepID=A0ABW0HR89_9BACL
MTKPTSIRIMLYVSYFKLALFLVMLVSLKYSEISEHMSFYGPFFLLSLLSMVYFIVTINKRKYLLSIVFAFLNFLVAFVNPIQQIASLVIMLLYVLKSTRDYMRGDTRITAASEEQAEESDESGENADSEGGADSADEASEGDKPALSLDKPQAQPKLRKDPEVTVREATAEDANTIYSLMMIAFEEYRTAIPPSSALDETEEGIAQGLQDGTESAAILFEDDMASAMVRFKIEGDTIHFYRLSVVPNRRRRGHARKLVQWIERHAIAKGLNVSRCKVRQSVQNNLVLYQNMGYEIVDQELIVRPEGTLKALTLEKKLGV